MRLFLKDMDRSIGIFCQRREFVLLFSSKLRPYVLFTFRNSLRVPQVAKQLKEQQMVMRGHRETSMVHELNR